MDKALRRAKSDLVINGVGVIVLGVWIFVKMALFVLFAQPYMNSLFEGLDPDGSAKKISIALLLIFCFLSMCFHIYVGGCAIREGQKGARRRRVYLILAVLLTISNISGVFGNAAALLRVGSDFLYVFCELLLEITRCIALISLLRAALRVKKLTKRMQREAASCAD